MSEFTRFGVGAGFQPARGFAAESRTGGSETRPYAKGTLSGEAPSPPC
jgi:hypothetical protein